MNFITIFGISGSGKSTFANKLGKTLDMPVIHLDKLYWTAKWQTRYQSTFEFQKVIEELVDKENKWIMDGTYKKTLKARNEKADIIIFFDFPKWICIWRAFIRIFNNKKLFDRPDGAKQKIGWILIKYIINYPNKELLALALSYQEKKKVFIIRNDKESQKVLLELKNNNYEKRG